MANYTIYKQYFKLLKIASEGIEFAKNKTKVLMMCFVSIRPSVIQQKVEIIIEHFRTVTIHKIDDRAG